VFRRSRRVAVALCTLLASAGSSPALAEGRFRATAVSHSVHDRSGDTEDIDDKVVDQPEADILDAGAEHRGGDIVFTMKVARPTDPTTTRNWEGRTRAAWIIYTNDARNPDYLVNFARDETGQLAVRSEQLFGHEVGRSCPGRAALDSNGAFVATVLASCFGDPGSIRYSADMRWDTDPTNDEYTDDTGIVTDRAPDDGANPAGPVTKP
jgi:hypothetical protein